MNANPATFSALRQAGWYPGRHLDVSSDIQSLEAQGYIPSPLATAFLESFRGLKIGPAREEGPDFIDGEPFFVDAVGAGGRHQDESSAIGSALGGSWIPLGWWLSDLMVSADRPLICVPAPEGTKPWPR